MEEHNEQNKDDDSRDKSGSDIQKKDVKQFLINRVTGGYKEKWKIAIAVCLFISIQFFIVYSALWTIPETKTEVVCLQKMSDDCGLVMKMANYCYMNSTNSSSIIRMPTTK